MFAPCPVKLLIPLIIIVVKGNISNKTNPSLRTPAPQWGGFAWHSFKKNRLLALSFPLFSLSNKTKISLRSLQHGTCDKDEQSELSEKQWYNHTHTVAAAFCNQFNLWGASHMSVCQSSLRKLNGAHFICNWMQIKISLMRGLKSWKGRLHAVNLRIWIMLEYAVPFYSLFLSSATPAKWINQSLPPSWKVKGKDSTTADEEHLSHSQSVDWSCSVQNLKGRDVSSSTELGEPAWDLVSC